jgi:hypothetical protein
MLFKVMPELGRLAAVMTSDEPLSFDEKLVVMKDLYAHCTCDYDVVYFLEESVNGRCPIDDCQKAMSRCEAIKTIYLIILTSLVYQVLMVIRVFDSGC